MTVASCTIASDEILVDLLTRAGHLERLVAVSTLVDDDRYSNLRPVPAAISGRCGGELESLLRLKPDLAVIASFNGQDLTNRLKAAGIRVHVLSDFTDLAAVATNIETLGDLIGEPKVASAAAAEYQRELERLTSKSTPVAVAPIRVLEYYSDGVVSGRNTMFDDLVRYGGGLNVGSERGFKGWPRVSAEVLATLKPDVIFASGELPEQPKLLALLRNSVAYKDMPATKSGRVIMIPQRELSAASPHVLKALAKIRAAIDGADKGRRR